MSNRPDHLEPTNAAHESGADLPLRPIAAGAAIVALLTIVGLVVSLWFFRVSAVAAEKREAAVEWTLPGGRDTPVRQAEPSLEGDPTATLREVRRAEQERLSTYRWVDRSAGVVAIPIERAMELVVRDGLPVAPAGPAPAEKGR